jgi:quercetin dioxygenase-like cupin family protein
MTGATHTVIAADVAALLDTLPVEAGAVCSTRVYKAPDVTLVRLSMDTGTVMKEHIAQSPLLVTVLDGQVALEVGGERVELRSGGVVHIDARVPHAVEAIVPSHLLLTLGGRASTANVSRADVTG